MKKMLTCGLVITLIVALMSGCSERQQTSTNQETIAAQKAFATSTPQNDTDAGLKTIKVDSAMVDMTEEQYQILRYFDNDYLEIWSYEFLRRYPQVFDQAQITESGIVKKILAQSGTKYELLLQIGEQDEEVLLLRGDTNGPLFLEGDYIKFYGIYSGIETIAVDGTSFTLPCANVYDTYMPLVSERFDFPFIKAVAKSVFGENIEVRTVTEEENQVGYDEGEYYAVVLDNQSNAKLSKFFLDANTGYICDESVFQYYYYDGSVERHVEFSADLKHFFVVSYDWALETFTIECYDHNLNKEWKREFEEVQPLDTEGLMSRCYDYTKNNFYLALNNELYIINAKTGEDTRAPMYVGPKIAVSKLNDGILLIAASTADAFMKVDIEGGIVWKTNASGQILSVNSLQMTADNIVLYAAASSDDGYSDLHYFVLDCEDGHIVVDAVEM